MIPIVIESGTVLDKFDHHFRVFAGPGAGKTYWLVRHIANVVMNSQRLTPCSYVACISYTNVAVEEIDKGLGRSSERAKVSTIHSFLYSHVVKPYLHLLRNESGDSLVAYALVDGHDEHRPSFSAVKEWLKSVDAKLDFYANIHEIFAYLKTVSWQRDDSTGTWSLKPFRWVTPPKYLPTTKLDSYKPFYWRNGIIDHDDVLYFTYRILDGFVELREFLSRRFPYLFIDEFQDTNPIQTQIIKWLAGEHTIVGVIGDVQQSIYSFQGAKPTDFENFSLPTQVDYVIDDNRRSTDAIIRFLNHVRGNGIEQKGLRQTPGEAVRVCVGSVEHVVSFLNNQLPTGEQLTILARTNEETSAIRRLGLASPPRDDLWDELAKIDADRFHFLEHLISAGELAHLQHYSLALIKLIRGIRIRKGLVRKPLNFDKAMTELQRRGLAVSLIHFLVNHYDQLCQSLLADAYQQIDSHLSATIEGLSLTRAVRGRFKEFSLSRTYGMLADGLPLPDETRSIRTIHKAKSAEFDNVLVSFRDSKQLGHILRPREERSDREAEEKRVTYVALSRARDRLAISIPDLSEGDEIQLRKLGCEVVRLDHHGSGC